jgi:excisionase family DNA binding protein
VTPSRPYTPPADRALLSADELGEYLGISENFARRLIDEAPLQTVTLGRLRKVYRKHVDEWLADQARQSLEERAERDAMVVRVLNGGARIATGRKR